MYIGKITAGQVSTYDELLSTHNGTHVSVLCHHLELSIEYYYTELSSLHLKCTIFSVILVMFVFNPVRNTTSAVYDFLKY